MGNQSSTIVRQVADVDGAAEELHRLSEALAKYRVSVYKSEFGVDLPKPNDPDLVAFNVYANMSRQTEIDSAKILAMVNSVLVIPPVLTNQKQEIVTTVATLADSTLAGAASIAFSKSYTWRVIGNDDHGYLFTAVVASTKVDNPKWRIPGGVSCQTAMTVCYRAGISKNGTAPLESLVQLNVAAVGIQAESDTFDFLSQHLGSLNRLDAPPVQKPLHEILEL
ncbi:hypothetical protein BC939DRAFT_471340 [Gamsiella multidivaricata]|uniref:uncharacterized protein n=1 Tax=Gamsiella multidivaricata TaxID=101098 RepID=UPI00222099A9|nr:uncharacterized protein BC939DRAFT_471340 [Gamsiella multidivaricata]KAG0361449.1 hypothetical protein BGZ54_009095 [Gamsiella multidivaricata]KAI7815828.1 hypothetical protein BC939DRAFT_471340 [Gamsiella multidivaricata]